MPLVKQVKHNAIVPSHHPHPMQQNYHHKTANQSNHRLYTSCVQPCSMNSYVSVCQPQRNNVRHSYRQRRASDPKRNAPAQRQRNSRPQQKPFSSSQRRLEASPQQLANAQQLAQQSLTEAPPKPTYASVVGTGKPQNGYQRFEGGPQQKVYPPWRQRHSSSFDKQCANAEVNCLKRNEKLGTRHVTMFGRVLVSIASEWFVQDPDGYLQRSIATCLCDLDDFLSLLGLKHFLFVVLIYVERYVKELSYKLPSNFVRPVFLVSGLLTLKFWFDWTSRNIDFSKRFGIPKKELYINEVRFLSTVEHCLSVSATEVDVW
eukprot:CAMPEP_0174271844 /NCGR_PEP_ID=MMETSP0439-20130205/49221_1 /TAXON_ID=0 /ORGANISM="Stereomyxa ramosa, Strain Chinc5" /LENGTH=316 /DNA_ID=CAMNT_0015362085 /DNA_START=122 /DNA_END=1069 /DNA_ORIENTATION=-